MAHFFPAASRLDTERNPSLNRRAHSRNTLREATASNDTPSDTRSNRPSHVSWLQNPMATNQAGPPLPRRPPTARLGRSSSLSAIPPALHRQSSTISNHSLQLDSSSTRNPAAASTHPVAMQLSPISERSYVPTPGTPRREQFTSDVEPTTPISIGSSYSAFLRRPLKRSISATSTSSLLTNATSTQPPILPPLNLSPVDIRPAYPPVSRRSGLQLVSTVYEDAGSERTGSFITARSDSDDGEDAENSVAAPNAPAGPSNSTILSSFMQPGSKSDLDRGIEGTTLTTTQPSGSGLGESSSSSAFGPVPPARPRPRRRVTTPSGSGSGGSTSDVVWRRWTRELSLGSRLSRPSFSAARRAVKSRLPPLPILLFWAGFVAPWCWLIGGWLIAEGRWEDNGKVRAALPLWKPRPAHAATATVEKGKRPRRGAGAGTGARENQTAVAGGPLLPFDPFAKDLEQGDAAAVAAVAAFIAQDGRGREGQGRTRTGDGAGGLAGGPRQWWYWVPCACWAPFARLRHRAAVPASGPGPSPEGEQVVTFVKPYSAEVWVYRCRLAAVLSAVILLIALIVAVVVLRHSNS